MNAVAAMARPFAALGEAVTAGAQMVFARTRGWGVLLARTRIDYATEVGDPARNSIVGAVVGWISRNFPEAPVRIVRNKEQIKPGPTGPGKLLRLLERPNPYYSGPLQWMATITDFVAGNAYWIKQRASSGRVIAYWWVPAPMIEPRWPDDDPTVFIGWYEYKVDGVTYAVDPSDVVHFRNGIDPLNTRKGLSRLGALYREIFTDEEAANFTASLLRNLGVPGVVLAPSNTTGPTQKSDPETVKTKFMEKFGGDKRGEPLVLTAPTDVKVLSFNPQQMELRELRRIPEERVSAVTGVPAGVAGLGAGLDRNTFSNYGEANKAAYTQGVIPLHRLIGAELEVQALPDFATIDERDEWEVFFDAAVVAAMQEAADAVWKRNESAATKGLITRAQFKKAVGLEPAADGSDDVYVYPNNFIFDDAAGGNQPPGSGPRLLDAPAAADEPALIEAGADAEVLEVITVAAREVRCESCGKLLAEKAAVPYRIACSRCKKVTEAAA